MKKFALLTTLLMSIFIGQAQPPDYSDLLVMFADGSYDKLVKNAENYTMKESTKNDALPFYWLAKGLYAMSKDAEYTSQEKYKNAYKDAITAIGKFHRKDKDGSIFREYREFFSEFKKSMVEIIENELSTKNYAKAYSWIIKVPKVSPSDIGSIYLTGVCKFQQGDKSGASTSWKEADAALAKITSVEDWNDEDLRLLAVGVIETAECYVNSRRVDQAKTLLNKVFKWLEDDEDFKSRYDAIING